MIQRRPVIVSGTKEVARPASSAPVGVRATTTGKIETRIQRKNDVVPTVQNERPSEAIKQGRQSNKKTTVSRTSLNKKLYIFTFVVTIFTSTWMIILSSTGEGGERPKNLVVDDDNKTTNGFEYPNLDVASSSSSFSYQNLSVPSHYASATVHTETILAKADKADGGNITIFSLSIKSNDDENKSNGNNKNHKNCRNNAIVLLAQKKHATYGRDSYGPLIQSLSLLSKNYLSINNHADNVDVYLFHTGDFDTQDLFLLEPILTSGFIDDDNDEDDAKVSTTKPISAEKEKKPRRRIGILKLVDLSNTIYWTLPSWHAKDNQSHWTWSDVFPIGYRHMCRWFGIKIWRFFDELNTQQQPHCNYRHILRIDEDSLILSKIEYDIFDYMKSNNFVYGYRLCAYELYYNRNIGMWFNKWQKRIRQQQHRHITPNMCGFYNNFFVADIQFFNSMPVKKYLKEIDRQGFIYRKRYGDLMIHTSAVYAYANATTIHRFLDFTYQHVTIDHIIHPKQGCVVWGGIQAGYNDPMADITLEQYIRTHVVNKKCTANSTIMEEKDLSPTYQHIPDSLKGKVKLKTIIAGKVELPNQGILSG